MSESRSRIVRVAASLWRILDATVRGVVTLTLLALIVLVLVAVLSGRRPRVPDSTALVVAPAGFLVEQLAGDPLENALWELTGRGTRAETLVRPILEAIDAAREDERVKVLVLELDRLAGGGLSKLQEIGAAIDGFRESGKTVVATADFYPQASYYLAARADEVWLHEEGLVLVPGYGSYRRYYKEALDRLSVDWHVFRVGEYKSAVEPYIRDDMSPEAREDRRVWLEGLWRGYAEDVERARGLAPRAVQDYAERFHEMLGEHGGDAAATALAAGLVDKVAPRDEVRARLVELVGEDESTGSFFQVGYGAYLDATERDEKKSDNKIAVVVASGTILDGEQLPGAIGGDSTGRLIRSAREDEEVKAVVLRVDSPGGSAFASEIIRREVELTREAGKPVVASMGSVAASGGYWISMSADEIWASPSTLTGSIGIYAMVPTFSRSLARLGVHSDGVGTAPLAGRLRPDLDLPEEAAEVLRQLMQKGYRDFITKAAEGRGRSEEEIDRIARGRVWIGSEALELGLVDRLGGLDEAVASAAALAGVGDDYRRRFVEPERSKAERLLSWLVGWSARGGAAERPAVLFERPERFLAAALEQEVAGLASSADPVGVYAYCFCRAD